jgi:hypothetical protein
MTDELKTDLETIPIGTLPVGCLKAAKFRIPEYQRGYRWKKDDVTKLLEDLEEFIEEGKAAAKTTETVKALRSFYCLQPLVVTKSDEHPSEWEVVDGQQRLTTLFLIWNVLNGKAPYVLSYETRRHSEKFLKQPFPPNQNEKDEKRHPNIDFHHIYLAHKTIIDWFGSNEPLKTDFIRLLSDSNPNGRNVRFIWYRLEEGADADAPEEVFTRLNDRKIPLTDEELIRALFLISNKSSQVADQAFQHRLALEWDRMETALQEPDFWGFLSHENPPEGGRIRLLFQLCAPPPPKERDKDHYLFTYYHGRLTGKTETPADVWKEIIDCFEQLEEWYRDPELFHLVGYFTTILGNTPTATLRNLLKDVKSPTKQQFASTLRQSIRTKLIGEAEATSITAFVSGLNFDTKLKTRQTLAIFNITTILRTKGVRIRFPFHLYHDTKVGWDIEHIQSQAGDDLGGDDREETPNRKRWLKECKTELQHDAAMPSADSVQEEARNVVTEQMKLAIHLMAEIDEFKNPGSSVKFPELEKKIRQHFGETESTDEQINDIGNLTLLDAPTNRGYGNAPFVVKRNEILKPERPEGTFILPCTRDLFLKVFSKNPGNLRRWDIEKDGTAHETAIREALENFFGEKGGAK